MRIQITEFARHRLFPKSRRNNAINDISAEEFEQQLNRRTPQAVLDGYAPFCKLHVHENWTSTRCATIAITATINHMQARDARDLRQDPVLPLLLGVADGAVAGRCRAGLPGGGAVHDHCFTLHSCYIT